MTTYDAVLDYAKEIGVAFTHGDVEEILNYSRISRQDDARFLVWEYLDNHEGIQYNTINVEEN